MIPFSATLTFSELLKGLIQRQDKNMLAGHYIVNGKYQYHVANRSTAFLSGVIDFLYEIYQRPIELLLPGYFCKDVISAISSQKLNIRYFQLNPDLSPAIESIENLLSEKKPDLCMAVNYFDSVVDLSSIKIFCDKYSILFIEDCAHQIKPVGDLGKLGDLVIFSPYKQLPFGYLSILLFDSIAINMKVGENHAEKFDHYISNKITKRTAYLGDMKYVAKRLVLNYSPFLIKKQYLKRRQAHGINNFSSMTDLTLSKFTIKLYLAWIKNIDNHAEKIKIQSEIWDGLMLKSIQKNIKDSTNNLSFARNYLVSSSASVSHLLPWNRWSNVPDEVCNTDRFPIAKQLKDHTYYLPTYYSFQPKKIMHHSVLDSISTSQDMYVSCQVVSANDYQKISHKMTELSVLQDARYISHKQKDTTWKQEFLLLYNNKKVIGCCAILFRKFPIMSIVKINMGPTLSDNSLISLYGSYSAILKHIKKSIGRSILFMRGSIESNEVNKHLLKSLGFKKFNKEQYITSYLNLSKDVESLFSSLKGKWRNQYRLAEKNNLTLSISSDKNILRQCFNDYLSFQNKLGFSTWNFQELVSLAELFGGDFKVYSAMYEKKCIAQAVLIRHGVSATYLLSWQSDLGRKYMSTNYLLWQAICKLKNNSVLHLDLGGIDIVSTPGVAKFKRGLSGIEKTFLGNYCRLV